MSIQLSASAVPRMSEGPSLGDTVEEDAQCPKENFQGQLGDMSALLSLLSERGRIMDLIVHVYLSVGTF